MIDSVIGTIEDVGVDHVVLGTPSGFSVVALVPDASLFAGKTATELRLFTSLSISGVMNGDGELKLYGFQSRKERAMFLLLKSVSGVGGSAALKIVAKGAVEVADSIAHGEPDSLRVKGVGPKITKRIVEDLQKKVAKVF